MPDAAAPPSFLYSDEIARIKAAKNLEEIAAVVAEFSVRARGNGGVLYSGRIGDFHSSQIIKSLFGNTDAPIIDGTPRARFLADENVEAAIKDRAKTIFSAAGEPPERAVKLATGFLYGDESLGRSETALARSLWGRASDEFVRSLRGDVTVIAAEASASRVFGAVELRAALENRDIRSLGGIPTETLRRQVEAAHGDLSGVLEEVQAKFRADLKLGIFRAGGGDVALSREFAEAYHLRGDYRPAAQLEAEGLARIGGSGIARSLERGNAALGVAMLAYDAARVSREYDALTATGNYFAAHAMVRAEALQTAGSWIGAIGLGAAAGAGYGALGGSPTGPGALVSGAAGGLIGGFVGAVGGQRLAAAITESQIDHQTGADGKPYVYNDGKWRSDQWFRSNHDASSAQVPTLDYRRTAAITELAIANPPKPDPDHIDVTDPRTHLTRTWDHREDGAWQSHAGSARGGRGTLVASHDSNPQLAAQLDAISAQRKFISAHGPELAANAFVMDYYGKGWDKVGPLPEAVTATLHLPSETRITDPTTKQTWTVDRDTATREEPRHGSRGGPPATITATGAELARILAERDHAVASNHQYGAQLIERAYSETQRQPSVDAPLHTGSLFDRTSSAVDRANRESQHPLPAVREATAWDGRPGAGSFVDLGEGLVAQHRGRGAYSVMDVARDLHGVTPPFGQSVTIDRAGHVATPTPELARSLGNER